MLAIAILGLLTAVAVAAPVLEERQQDGRFTFYNLKTPASGPCDLAKGPDGALWGEAILKNNIFRIDPKTGQVDEYPIPFTTPISNRTIPGLNNALIQDRTAFSCAIRRGADGNLYASNGLRNQLVQINPTTKAIRIFQPPSQNPLGDLQPFNDLYTAHDGIYLTQTTANTFQFFAFATESFTTYAVPTPLALPLGLYVDSHGIVYIAEMLSNKILTFDPKTLEMNEYPLPQPAQLPTVVRAEKDGYIYFALFTGNGIGRISQTTHAIDLYHTNQTGGIGAEDTLDAAGGVWYSFFNVDSLARLDTATKRFSYVAFPETFAGPTAAAGLSGGGVLGDVPPYVDVAVNYGPGDAIWFASVLENTVGRYDISGLYG
ncbi:uncharacterized protein LOC112000686 [Lecanosticta acicola]|uniref:Uncharacterized protein LOC112000686 n=1 Tax=Lecanosticta acicola TaxID=111012 RepID=A0AAI9E898_9PEZI|nr:uncharacterized protein LOC112000686 [Lecanosticta acicola]